MIGWLHPAHPAPPPSPHRKVALTRLAGRCCRQPDDVPRGVLQVSMAQQGRLHVRLIQARNLAFHTGVLSAFHTLVRCCSGSSPLRTCACARACARAPAHATEMMRQPLHSQKRPHLIAEFLGCDFLGPPHHVADDLTLRVPVSKSLPFFYARRAFH